MEIIVESSSFEKTKFGNVETAVEYIKRRVSENFVVYVKAGSQTQQIINEIKKSCYNVLLVELR